MDEDDLPPASGQGSSSFGDAFGRTLTGFLWIAIFIGLVAAALYGLQHWL